MVLDIQLLRTDKGGNPDLVRESQRRRFADEGLVDAVIGLDEEWRKLRGDLDKLKRQQGFASKCIGKKAKAKEPTSGDSGIPQEVLDNLMTVKEEDLSALSIPQLKNLSVYIKGIITETSEKMKEKEELRNATLNKIGNIVHEDVPVSNDEEENGVLRKVGNVEHAKSFLHNELMAAIDGVDTDKGAYIAGSRGYFMKGDLVLLKLALENYAIQFLTSKGYTPIYTPFFMEKERMAEVAQLEQFDEELYKVTGEGSDKYLIATSEQPIASYHFNEWIDPKTLPMKYAGYSSCFRKEAGSHKDQHGIFRVHQFEKIEQFVVTSPHDNSSWEMMETMIGVAESFYQSLGIGYRVVDIVSGALNNAAARKFDLEAWFPGSQAYRELVSCSNCTDYQARSVNARYGLTSKKKEKAPGEQKEFVHMLNATLCAISRTLCCIVETYQEEDGIVIPEVLRSYIGGKEKINYAKPPVKFNEEKENGKGRGKGKEE